MAGNYAQHIFDDMLSLIKDIHSESADVLPIKKMKCDATIQAMEVAYRALVHETMLWKAGIGVISPETEAPPAVLSRRAELKGLYRAVLVQMEAQHVNWSPREAKRLVAEMLESNLKRIIWQNVCTTASHIAQRAEDEKTKMEEAGRSSLDELILLCSAA